MIVTFDATEFRGFYPKFTVDVVSDIQLENYFNLACTLINNTDSSRIPYDPENSVYARKEMLYLLVCHLATMGTWDIGQTGPVQSATQGSVSVGYADLTGPPNASWYQQTPCGRTLWMMLRPYALGGRIAPVCGSIRLT